MVDCDQMVYFPIGGTNWTMPMNSLRITQIIESPNHVFRVSQIKNPRPILNTKLTLLCLSCSGWLQQTKKTNQFLVFVHRNGPKFWRLVFATCTVAILPPISLCCLQCPPLLLIWTCLPVSSLLYCSKPLHLWLGVVHCSRFVGYPTDFR